MADLTFAHTCVIFDFETTGMSPQFGDRAIEIGAVKLVRGKVVDRFQALMNPGKRIPAFIESFTGISNAMVAQQPCCEKVMQDFSTFIEGLPLVAHNASFDRRFLQSEFARIGVPEPKLLACSMLLARRLCREAPDHKLGTLVKHLSLPSDGTYHRALADAEMTTHLWCSLALQVVELSGLRPVPFPLMQKLAKKPIAQAETWLRKQA